MAMARGVLPVHSGEASGELPEAGGRALLGFVRGRAAVALHEETTDDGWNERREIRSADAAQAVLQRPQPVGRCGAPKVGPQLLLRTLEQLTEHPQVRLPVRAGDGPGAVQGGRVRLAGSYPQEFTERVELT